MTVTRIAIAGIGKIARDQHIPHIAANPAFEFVAGVTRGEKEGIDVPCFRTIPEMLAAGTKVDAIAICTPPIGRAALIADAFVGRLDVLLEKPPAATLSEAERFAEMACISGRLLCVSWHSREAPAVEPARAWLKDKTINRVEIDWLENVRQWHPGQAWIWEPGIGIFDPGINALSVVTRILPWPLTLITSDLDFPGNKSAPIAARLTLTGPAGVPVVAHFDFDQLGTQTWEIRIDTDQGKLVLTHGASRMTIDGRPLDVGDEAEYAALYRHFAELLDTRQSDIDLAPFRLVADAYLLGQRHQVAPFAE